MKMHRIGGLLILIMLLVFSFGTLAEVGIVNTGGGTVNFRKAPEDRAKIIMRINNRTEIEVLDHPDGWYHVSYKGKEGYIKEPFVTVLSESVGDEIYSNGSTVIVYDSMDDQSRIVGVFNPQQSMTIEAINSGWAYVSNGKAKGYVQISQIDQLNEHPVAAVSKAWVEGILQRELSLYSSPDVKSDVLSTWPIGTGVSVSPYNNNWSLVQILDEGICGYAKKASVKLNPMPAETTLIDDSQFISAAVAKSTAESALKKYSGFNAKGLTCRQDTALSTNGIRGPMYRFHYSNKNGQYVYAAYVHAYSGELLYTGDYSDFIAKQEAAKAAQQASQDNAPEGGGKEGGTFSPGNPDGTEIGKDAARSYADRCLASKYPQFSELTFSSVVCRHETEQGDHYFQTPYYCFDYYVDDGSGEDASNQLSYTIIFNSVTLEILYTCSAALGEGNG